MPFLLVEILNFQGSTHRIGVGSFSKKQKRERKTIMEKIKKRIANLKVAGKLKVYRMTVLVMTLFLVLVALISTVVIRSNIEKITKV